MLKLKGITLDSNPYIPECEKNAERPTVFWIRPKTVGLFHSVRRFDLTEETVSTCKEITEDDLESFTLLCEKVKDFQFQDGKDLIEEIIDKKELRDVVKQISSDVFVEIMNEINLRSTLSGAQRKTLELMTYFALVKNEDMSIIDRLSYNCNNCTKAERFKDRVCFFLNETERFTMPVLDEMDDFTFQYDVCDKPKEDDYSIELFLEEFHEVSEKVYPTVPAYLALSNLHGFMSWTKEICITGVIPLDYIRVLQWASDCKELHGLPYPGPLLSQPNQLMEAFDTIQATISQYEQVKREKIAPKSASGKS